MPPHTQGHFPVLLPDDQPFPWHLVSEIAQEKIGEALHRQGHRPARSPFSGKSSLLCQDCRGHWSEADPQTPTPSRRFWEAMSMKNKESAAVFFPSLCFRVLVLQV